METYVKAEQNQNEDVQSYDATTYNESEIKSEHSRSRSPYDRSRSRSPMYSRKRSRSRSYSRDRQQQQPQQQQQSQHQSKRRYNDNHNRNSARNSQADRELGLKYRWEKTIFVSNLPFDLRWTDLKDLFKTKIGEIMFCEVHDKGEGKSQGVASIEFKHADDADKAVDLMNGYEVGGRKITVRLDNEGFKTRQSKQISKEYKKPSSSSSSNDHYHSHSNGHQSHNNSNNQQSGSGAASANQSISNMLNLVCTSMGTNQSTLINQLAQQMNIEGPVTNRVFLASLDYRVDEHKIREVFALAGKINSVSLFRERDGKSRGMAVVEYSSEIEALNAISMFDRQVLNDRQMNVRFDTKPPLKEDEKPSINSVVSNNLPSGLKGIGSGLIPNTTPQRQPEVASVPGLAGLDLSALGALAASLTSGSNSLVNPALNSLSALAGLAGLTTSAMAQTPTIGSGLLATPHNTSPPKQGSNISKVFIKNFPFSWDERKLKEKFRQAGNIEFVEIKHRDGKSRGCGLIKFTSPHEAQKAVELFNGSRFEGRTLDVNLDKM